MTSTNGQVKSTKLISLLSYWEDLYFVGLNIFVHPTPREPHGERHNQSPSPAIQNKYFGSKGRFDEVPNLGGGLGKWTNITRASILYYIDRSKTKSWFVY